MIENLKLFAEGFLYSDSEFFFITLYCVSGLSAAVGAFCFASAIASMCAN